MVEGQLVSRSFWGGEVACSSHAYHINYNKIILILLGSLLKSILRTKLFYIIKSIKNRTINNRY